MPFRDRKNRLVHHLAVWSCLLALAVRILLPLLHTHADAHCHAAAPASPTMACSCGHHHAPGPTAPHDPATEDGERMVAAEATSGAACTCLACELEHGVPCAAPPRAATVPDARSADAERPTDATTVRCKEPGPGHPCRAPPFPTGCTVAAG